MNLRGRLERIEARCGSRAKPGEARRLLAERLAMIGVRLKGGDLADRDDASPAECVALALERGDADMARALLMKAAGRASP